MSFVNDTTGFTQIDFSQLPPPDVVKPIDVRALKMAAINQLAALDPAFAEVLESDPAAKLIEVNAYDRSVDRQFVNDTAHAVMLPYSWGHDLDVLGSLLAVKRLVVGTDTKGNQILEDDERFRRRIQLAPEAFSVAGPRGAYIFWALTLAATIPDASLYLIAPGQLQLTLLGASSTGLPTDDELLKVREGFKLRNLTPLTDYLVVAKPIVVPYKLEADIWLFPGPDAATVQNKITAAVDKFLVENRRLGRDHPRSGLIAAIQQPGVSRVNLITPPQDILVDERRVVLPLNGIELRLSGRSE